MYDYLAKRQSDDGVKIQWMALRECSLPSNMEENTIPCPFHPKPPFDFSFVGYNTLSSLERDLLLDIQHCTLRPLRSCSDRDGEVITKYTMHICTS